MKKLHSIFESVWLEMGYSWEDALKWASDVHAPFLKSQHQEKDHSKNSIRRYIMDLLNLIMDWPLLERRKLVKICETGKLKTGEKYCLAFHASPRRADLLEMGGVKWKDLKRLIQKTFSECR